MAAYEDARWDLLRESWSRRALRLLTFAMVGWVPPIADCVEEGNRRARLHAGKIGDLPL